jgi:mono/diheme cytochrome c family protein
VTCRALALVVAVAACATAPPEDERSGTTASSLAFGPDGRLWVASPDDDALVGVNPQTLAVERSVAVPGEPSRVLAVGDLMAVVGERSADLTLVGETTRTIPLPCGGATGLAALGSRLFVACPFDDRVVEVDATAGTVVRVLNAPGRPTAVAVQRGRLVVSASRLGLLRSAPLATLPVSVEQPVAWTETALPSRAGRSAVQLDALHLSAGRLVGVYQLVQHDGDRERAPEDGGYGNVADGDPRIEPRVLADCGGAYARFDGGDRAMSGPSAVALDAERGRLWVVSRGTGHVTVFGCEAGAAPTLLPILASFQVGDGARGIVLDAAGDAWVDVAFDHAVARLSLREKALTRARQPGPIALSEAAQRGRRLFHDARNVHLTPSGIVSCATCHPGGGDDGLNRFLHTRNVPRKLRRTPPAWAIRPEERPLHWDGAFTDADALVRSTLAELMEGDGLLVDTSAIVAWMRERPPPIGRPGPMAARGAEVFGEAGCGECHIAGGTDGRAHDVLPPSPDPDGDLPAVVTPSLAAIRARAPYFHDGRAASLGAVLDQHAPELTEDDRSALLDYLESL